MILKTSYDDDDDADLNPSKKSLH